MEGFGDILAGGAFAERAGMVPKPHFLVGIEMKNPFRTFGYPINSSRFSSFNPVYHKHPQTNDMCAMKNTILMAALLCFNLTHAQELKPGFEKAELEEMIRISANFADTGVFADAPDPEFFTPAYRSPEVGLRNMWELWTHTSKPIAVISTRGTAPDPVSWLANFYAAMVPATGYIILAEADTFRYSLAQNERAAVHVGWLVATAILSRDILPKVDSLYQAGYKDFLLGGHSQGGGITYLLTAYLRNLQQSGDLPADIQFKTYCSAAPKPGNLYFAYDYEAMTQFGWAFNAVNTADWVPEVPMSIQTTDDFNATNPFVNARKGIKEQKFPNNIVLTHVYNSLDKPTRKAQKNYQKYLGEKASSFVSDNIPGFKVPAYYPSNHYVRVGRIVALQADDAYYTEFPESDEDIFVHHSPPAYRRLIARLPDDKAPMDTDAAAMESEDHSEPSPNGTWTLTYISRPIESFESMYPSPPTMEIDIEKAAVSGYAGCNTYRGSFMSKGKDITFKLPFALTRKYCEGMGELHFLQSLSLVNRYVLAEDGSLIFKNGKTDVMRFVRMEEGDQEKK
jgi:heat shock protein HslJ